MNIYQNIINWSKSRPLFWQDAICRILQKQQLVNDDFEQLTALLKKEVGLSDTDISASIPNSDSVPQMALGSNAIRSEIVEVVAESDIFINHRCF